MTAWKDDPEFIENTVEKVQPSTRGWEVSFDDGWCLVVTSKRCQVEPKVGETILCFGRGVGYEVRGVVIGGRVYSYQTREEHEQGWRQKVDKDAQEKQKRAEEERPERDRRIEALPQPLQERLRRFLQTKEEFAADFEPYELFVCEQAALIANKLGDPKAIREFSQAKTAEQKEMIPDLDFEEHSGNTFGCACRIAWLLVEHPDLVVKEHGALCPLVGCENYGCWAQEAK